MAYLASDDPMVDQVTDAQRAQVDVLAPPKPDDGPGTLMTLAVMAGLGAAGYFAYRHFVKARSR
jgi:hypothetical protein